MSNQAKPQSPYKPRGKNLDYFEWCDTKPQSHERDRWLETLHASNLDTKACANDSSMQESVAKYICQKQSPKKNGSRYQKLLDDPLIKQRKIFTAITKVVKVFCQHELPAKKSATLFKPVPISQKNPPPKFNLIPVQNQSLPKQQFQVDDDIKIDEKNEENFALEQQDQEFSSKIDKMDLKQD